jgi:hypothetical protein
VTKLQDGLLSWYKLNVNLKWGFQKTELLKYSQSPELYTGCLVGSSFYDAFSVTRVYSIDEMVNDDELERIW